MRLKTLGKSMEPDIKILSGPAFVIIIVIILTVIVFKIGYSRVRLKLDQYNEIKQSETSLVNKLSVLKEVGSGVLDQADTTLIAVPEENPAAIVISNLRSAANQEEVTVQELKMLGTDDTKEVKTMGIKISTQSKEFLPQVTFLKNLLNSVPIQTLSTLELVQVTGAGGIVAGDLELNIYWASLPLTLPEIKAPVGELSAEQQQVLAKIQNYRKPVFTTLNPQIPKVRPNPFN